MPYNPYSPRAFPLNEHMIIAPFWADVDTRGIGHIYFRQTNDSTLLTRAANELRAAFPTSDVNVTKLFIVTWNATGYFDQKKDKVC